MHDLNTINRLNLEAHGKAIEGDRLKGKHVVATYEGLHLTRHSSFDDGEMALQFAEAERRNAIGRTVHILPPLAEAA
jgi:hypothetical protein